MDLHTFCTNFEYVTYGYGRQQPIAPTSHNDFELPLNPFTVMTPIPPTHVTEPRSHHPANDDIPIQQGLFDVSEVSKPSLLDNLVKA